MPSGRRKIRGTCKACEAVARQHRGVEDSSRYVVTYAQNATPIHRPFWESLQVYCEENDAKLVVLPGRYKNPTSQWSKAASDDDWWAPEVVEFLLPRQQVLRRQVILHGDISIQPTAVRPLTGFEAYAGRASGIFGHTKLELSVIPGAERENPKIFATTGACTVPNYTDSKAGKKGQLHHVHGAAIIEFDDEGGWHLRHVNAQRNGAFYDLDKFYSGDGVQHGGGVKALITGDLHHDQLEPAVDEATFGEGGMVDLLEPETLVYHDALDFRRRNSHRRDDPMFAYRQASGFAPSSVEDEVHALFEFLEDRAPESEPVVVRANHDEQLDRWLRQVESRLDPANFAFWCRVWLDVMAALDTGEVDPNPLELAYRRWCTERGGEGRVRFLKRDESLEIGGIYIHLHGDQGANGARGSVLGFAKLGVKTVTGHGHAAMIRDGAYRVGVSGKLDMEYNRGPSSWTHTHCIVHRNGKRQLLTILSSGRWKR